jgi:hypothetical protein
MWNVSLIGGEYLQKVDLSRTSRVFSKYGLIDTGSISLKQLATMMWQVANGKFIEHNVSLNAKQVLNEDKRTLCEDLIVLLFNVELDFGFHIVSVLKLRDELDVIIQKTSIRGERTSRPQPFYMGVF